MRRPCCKGSSSCSRTLEGINVLLHNEEHLERERNCSRKCNTVGTLQRFAITKMGDIVSFFTAKSARLLRRSITPFSDPGVEPQPDDDNVYSGAI